MGSLHTYTVEVCLGGCVDPRVGIQNMTSAFFGATPSSGPSRESVQACDL